MIEACIRCHSRSTRFPGSPFCRVCHDTNATTTDLYEAFLDDDGEPVHVDGCGCVKCTGGRHAEGATYYAL